MRTAASLPAFRCRRSAIEFVVPQQIRSDRPDSLVLHIILLRLRPNTRVFSGVPTSASWTDRRRKNTDRESANRPTNSAFDSEMSTMLIASDWALRTA